jgi:hypothetical protein
LNLTNIKILLAPILAIVLALSLAGAINSSMLPTDSGVHVQPTPQPSSLHSTPQPMAAGPMGSSNSFILFIVGAVLIGMVAVLLFFREKDLTKSSTNNRCYLFWRVLKKEQTVLKHRIMYPNPL